jgi:hypothetical protein
LRISAYGGAGRARGGEPLRHVSVFANGSDYAGMEDNDLRGFLDGRFRYGWNQPTQMHVRAGRLQSAPRWGEYELFRALYRWEGIDLPPEVRVHRAALRLAVEKGPRYRKTLTAMLYEVKKDWNPGEGGTRRDNNSPPKEGEVWWGEVARGRKPWGLPGVGFASDTHPDADTGAMPLAEARWEPGQEELVFESPALARCVQRRVREGRPLLFLLKLSDRDEDRHGSAIHIYSGNVDDDHQAARRPSSTGARSCSRRSTSAAPATWR